MPDNIMVRDLSISAVHGFHQGLDLSLNPEPPPTPLQLDDPAFNLRSIHLRLLIEEGLSLKDWEAFVAHFQTTLEGLEDIPSEVRLGRVGSLLCLLC